MDIKKYHAEWDNNDNLQDEWEDELHDESVWKTDLRGWQNELMNWAGHDQKICQKSFMKNDIPWDEDLISF